MLLYLRLYLLLLYNKGSGYVAGFSPFYSTVKLPSKESIGVEVCRIYYIVRCGDDFDPELIAMQFEDLPYGIPNEANYSCIRSSLDGVHLKQICDDNPNTGLIKNTALSFISELKMRHWYVP